MRNIVWIAVFAALVAFAFAADPSPPKIPNTFEARVTFEFHKGDMHDLGEGAVVQDQDANKGLEMWEVYNRNHSHLDVYQLQRFDLGKEFMIDSENKTHCYEKDVKGNLPGWFDWVAKAAYVGKHRVRHMMLDFWVLKTPTVEIGVGVDPRDTSRPVLFGSNATDGSQTALIFEKFEAHNPPSHWFDVPRECGGN